MDFGTIKIVGIILLVVIICGYFLVITKLNERLKKGSRASRFKVGGTPYKPDCKPEDSREERRKRKEVSLRDGPMFKRRFR